jgi:hypothetical protein
MFHSQREFADIPVASVCLSFLVAACSSRTPSPNAIPERDFVAHPAIHVESTPAARVWVLSDIHGGFDRLVALLQGQGLIDANSAWIAGNARLYVLGDMIDKYMGGLATIRLLRGLQAPAAAAGGEVVVTMGNHEAEFLANPDNDKAGPFLFDLLSDGIDPAQVASGENDIGLWLRDLPFAIHDGDWFFSHAGNTGGRSVAALGAAIQADVRTNKFAANELLGPDSLLESTLWWETQDPVATVEPMLAALPAKHIVFGHDPGALADRGSLGELVGARIFPVDVGMSPAINYSNGALLRIERNAAGTIVSAAFPQGAPAVIYQE